MGGETGRLVPEMFLGGQERLPPGKHEMKMRPQGGRAESQVQVAGAGWRRKARGKRAFGHRLRPRTERQEPGCLLSCITCPLNRC